MRIRLCYAMGMLMASCLPCTPAMSADTVAPLPGLDTCIAAALQQRPGVLFGWRVLSDAPQAVYKMSVLTADGRIADADCSPSATANLRFQNRIGGRRYEPYKEIGVPESAARKTAPLVFAGTVKIMSMQIGTDIKGRLWYEYRMELPSGHRATSHVDTVSGFLTSADATESGSE